jgi:D-galactarolactone cycloisomerase|tara:strand:- start:1056 stop:2174 length:1119 start_codon:yes stop_codon:yes gene_type:complete
MKIKDLRLSKLKLIEHLGEVEPAWSPGTKVKSNIGGGSFVEIELDNGEIGIGPSCDENILNDAKNYLIGKSPIDVISHFKFLIYKTKNIPYNGLAGIDIALWDLKGKIEKKSISEILGRKKDFLIPYASFVILSDPEERAHMSSSLDKEGWKAIKVRLHHENENLDIATIEEIVGNTSSNLKILVDANQAQSSYPWQPGVIWDFDRAKRMNNIMNELGCYWLEEPRPRFNYDELSELVAMKKTKIAGGENNTVVSDFHQMVEKNSYNILQPESMVLGGITPLIEIGQLSLKYNKEIVPHHGGGDIGVVAHMHLLSTWENAPFCEILHDPPLSSYKNKFYIFNESLEVKDGIINVPKKPGLGVSIKEDIIIRK